jgi:hypothetical protein
LRIAALAMVYLLYRAGEELLGIGRGSGALLGGFSPKWLAGLAAYYLASAVAGGMCVWAFLLPDALLTSLNQNLIPRLIRLGSWRKLIAGAMILGPSSLLLGEWGKHLTTPIFRIVLMSGVAITAGIVISQDARKSLPRIGGVLLVTASVFALAKRLVLVTDYPFKLYWSEGNRLWDYSLYFIRDHYQFVADFSFPSYLAPGRHGLWGMPFTIPDVGIALVRLWDVVLWTGPYFLLGWLLFSPSRIRLSTSARVGLSLWSLLFLTQGGVFAPLILSMALLAWRFDARRVRWVAGLAAAASFYAGISRWTWIVAPAMIAGLWVLLNGDVEPDRRKRLTRGFGVGAAGALGGLSSQLVMAIAFPRPEPVFSTSLNQPLLWYRLLPNPTNEQGILLGALLAVGPLLALLVWGGVKRRSSWGWLEGLGLGLALATFLAVGLTASVKIGGGSNLHNLDMFLVGLMMAVTWAAFRLRGQGRLRWSTLPIGIQGLAILAIAIPSFDVVRSGGPLLLPSDQQVQESLSILRSEVEIASSNGEVLFIDQRQLITFGEIEGVPLVADYELKDMMNQAMSANTVYFDQFRQDLASHRFELIVTDPLPGFVQGSEYEFGEENDAWLEFAAGPLNRYYQPIEKLSVGIWLLAPARDQ